MISNQNPHDWNTTRQFQNLYSPNFLISSSRNILRQLQNLSLPNFLISSTRNYSKTISKLVFAKFPNLLLEIILRQLKHLSWPQILLYKSQITCFQLAHRMILLALAQISKDTWSSGYKYPVHNHNIHSLSTIHLLNSTRQNSFRPPPQFLTSPT